MAQLEESKTIVSNIIEVLVRLDKEMREHHRTSKDFKSRMIGINSILTRVEKDFSEDLLIYIILRVKGLLGHNLPLNHIILKKLVNRGCIITNVHSVSSYK